MAKTSGTAAGVAGTFLVLWLLFWIAIVAGWRPFGSPAELAEVVTVDRVWRWIAVYFLADLAGKTIGAVIKVFRGGV